MSPSQNQDHDSGYNEGHGEGHGGIHLASWKWSEFSSPIMFTGLIITAMMLKIIFHHMPFLEKLLPESCVLIIVGIFAGVLIHYVILDDIIKDGQNPFPQFTAQLFFEFLLPPIILDSALALYDDAFFDNFVSIMIFAIFGTLLNTFTIGYSLYGLASAGVLGTFEVNNTVTGVVEAQQLTATECLIFSSLISAVDPGNKMGTIVNNPR